MTKKRVLFCSEASINNTGYSLISKELLSRLHVTGKYEVAELATYAKAEDPRINYSPWKIYPVVPKDGDQNAFAQYNGRPDGQFGAWCFDAVCLEFKPDVVIDIRDPWMCLFQVLSPLREYYSHLFMPTVDACPQTDDWGNQYIMSDGLLSYTEFGKETLKKTCGNNINFLGVASPGANLDDMKPLNKKEVRAKYGLPEDIIMLGMVARNQIRKLYPDLFKCFRIFLDNGPKELTDKTFLHVHTAHPDQGWDIPRLLKEYGLSHKVYLTYCCRSCGNVSIEKWNDYNLLCKRCNNKSVFNPNPAFGVNRQTLCEIYNLYDLYVQYASLEGFGVPVVEAAACGIPVCVVPYSGTEDFVSKLNAYPIPIIRMTTEAQSHRQWAFPDNDLFAKQLEELLSKDLTTWGKETRLQCEKYFDWDKAAKVWEDAIDSLPPAKRKWNDPPRNLVEKPIPSNLDDSEYIKSCFRNVSFCDHLCKGFQYAQFLKLLHNGTAPNGNQNVPFTRNEVYAQCKGLQQATLHLEAIRCQ